MERRRHGGRGAAFGLSAPLGCGAALGLSAPLGGARSCAPRGARSCAPRGARSCAPRGASPRAPRMLGPRVGGAGGGGLGAAGSGARRAEAARVSGRFREWLVDRGMYLSPDATWGRPRHPLAIADETTDDGEPSGRGLVAVKGLNQGDPLFQVPVEVVMTRERAVELVPELRVGEGGEEMNEYLALAVLLISEREKGEASEWGPYIEILPKAEEMNCLFLWEGADLEQLAGSPTLAAGESLRLKLRAEYESVVGGVFEKDRARFPEAVYSFDAWLWAFGILFSRAIMLQKAGFIALVPYADLINHSPFCSTYIDMHAEMLTGDRHVALYTDRPYSKMDQVFVTYGPKSNADLLLLYGFVSDRNPYDAVEISVYPDPADPLYPRKVEILASSGVDGPADFPLYADRYPMELIEFLRFCVAEDHELDDDFGDFISEDNEARAAQALTDACRAALDAYPQTIAEDAALVADRALYRMLSVRARCAIRQRLGEKRILDRTINNIAKERAEPSYLFSGPSGAGG